jgi:hypothetical protein
MTEPASWLLVEPGWQVRSSDGREVGTAHEVVGDKTADIFDGLAVKSGALSTPRYVPSEQVGEIEPGVIHLTISRDEFEQLPRHEEPATSERILPETASLGQRIASRVRRVFGGR